MKKSRHLHEYSTKLKDEKKLKWSNNDFWIYLGVIGARTRVSYLRKYAVYLSTHRKVKHTTFGIPYTLSTFRALSRNNFSCVNFYFR